MKKILSLLCIMVLVFSLSACSNQQPEEQSTNEVQEVKSEKVDIKIACAETTQALVEAVVPIMEAKGYNVTYQLFDNNVNAMVATNDGSVDSLFVVHKPFMENFNSANNADLVMIEPHVFSVGMGVYSEKYKSIDELPEGASISIMNDAMNMDRALRIFSDAGLLKLKDGVDKYTILDIESNPKNYKFVEMDQTQTVRSLQDMDAAVAFFSHMKNADKDFKSYLIRDQHPENYPQGVVVKQENANEQWTKDLVEAFRSDEVKAFADEHYGGLYEYIQ